MPASTYVVGETFSWAQEALIALDVIRKAKQTAVITLAMHKADVTREDWTVADACQRLADAGADVVGLNCIRGPATMMPLLREIRARVKTHMAALPVPYRTSEKEPSFQSLCDTHWHYAEGTRPFPVALDPFTCNRYEIAEFGREAMALDIRYLGVCCGAGPHHIRALAEAVGKRRPQAGIRRTCRSTRSWARTSGSSRCRRTTRTSSSGVGAGPSRRPVPPLGPATRQSGRWRMLSSIR